MDGSSGGEVKFYRLNRENNLTETIDYAGLMQRFGQEGIAMTPNLMHAAPLAELAKTDPEARKALDSLDDGTAEIVASTPGMFLPWTEEDKKEFLAVIEESANDV
jgi:hypothetical protein